MFLSEETTYLWTLSLTQLFALTIGFFLIVAILLNESSICGIMVLLLQSQMWTHIARLHGNRKGRHHPSQLKTHLRLCDNFLPSLVYFRYYVLHDSPQSTKIDGLEAEADFEFTS